MELAAFLIDFILHVDKHLEAFVTSYGAWVYALLFIVIFVETGVVVMMKDRVYGVTQTIYHGPYYTRHVVSPARILSQEGGTIRAEANYAVFRTKPGSVSEVYNVGRYIDELVFVEGVLKIRSRLCVYDSEMILNSLIYPV